MSETSSKNVYWSSCKVHVDSRPILMRPEFCGKIFKNYSNTKFHENPSVQWEPSSSTWMNGRTDRYEDANMAFRNFAKAPNIILWRRGNPNLGINRL
jgi:hypothetical protein